MRAFHRTVVALTLLAALVAGESTAQTSTPAVRVEVDIFSGRPNPFWELTASESAELLKRLRGLPQVSQGSTRDGLGYRGLIVTAKTGVIETFDSIAISNGIVVGRRAGASQRFTDKDRALEKWLLGVGKPHLDPAIYSEAAKGL